MKLFVLLTAIALYTLNFANDLISWFAALHR